jgi:hypothetical protein
MGEGQGRLRFTNGQGRGARTGAGISLSAHAVLGLLVWTGAATSGRVKGVDVGSGEMGAVAVGLIEDALPTPPATVASVTKPDEAPRRAVVAGTAKRKVSRSAIKVPGPGEVSSAMTVPPIDAIQSSIESQTATPPVVESALAPPSMQAQVPSAPPQTGAPAEPVPATRPSPAFVEPEVATYLRSQDYFPSLPASLRGRGAHYQARLDICVSKEGRVVDVGFRQPAAPALDSVLASAVRSWRYRPLMVNGAPAPFCHRMTVSYETM